MIELELLPVADPKVVSIIIPVYKDVDALKDTAGSIMECYIPLEYKLELIVVNDGGDPGISRYCQSIGVKEVYIKPNKGSYYARNRGVEFSTGQYLGFVDADIFVDPMWIANALSLLGECDYIAGNIQVIPDKVSALVTRYQQLVDFNANWHMQTLHFGPTANLWVKRSVVERIGGFDERLFSAGDLDFGIRVHKTEGLIQCYGESVVVNHPPRNFKGLLRKCKRVAHGHSPLKGSELLSDKFSFSEVFKRNFGKSAKSRQLGIGVSGLRAVLFITRVIYRIIYKFSGNSTEYDRVVANEPAIVERFQH